MDQACAIYRTKRVVRAKWVLYQVVKDGPMSIFRDCQCTIHLDEKWFYVEKNSTTMWLLPIDNHLFPPHDQNKGSILKVMFLVTIGHPHICVNGTHFNGLLGVWPFTMERLVTHSSKNLP